jgi:hypothetical protein
MDIVAVTRRIEELATGRPFGQLQAVRGRIKGTSRLGSRIFRRQSTFRVIEDGHNSSYAFHFGGRQELQFNVGFEDNGKTLRYGVAFSFKGSRSFPGLDVLKMSFERFNQFVRRNPAYLSRFHMWDHQEGLGRSERLSVRPIRDDLFHWGPFVFVGNFQPARERSIDYGRILDDLDWLMPLYEFVEGKGRALTVKQSNSGFKFRPGCSIDTFSAKAVLTGRAIEIDLRQKRIQKALHSYLVSHFGKKNVGTELRILNRAVDLAVRKEGKLWYYEVKTARSVQQCIREAVGQLLEYSYWPRLREADRLMVVGEQAPTADSRKYISILRKRFKIPVEYQQFNLSSGELVHK